VEFQSYCCDHKAADHIGTSSLLQLELDHTTIYNDTLLSAHLTFHAHKNGLDDLLRCPIIAIDLDVGGRMVAIEAFQYEIRMFAGEGVEIVGGGEKMPVGTKLDQDC
jgi:hypothetical protein